jgi:hypothetical protein
MVSKEMHISSPKAKDLIQTPSPSFRKSYVRIVEDLDLEDRDEGMIHFLQPPPNFGMVAEGVYRSGYPTPKNFSFLKSLKLKSIL